MDVGGPHHGRPSRYLRGVVGSWNVGAKILRVFAILRKHAHFARVVEIMRLGCDVCGREQHEREPGHGDSLPEWIPVGNAAKKRHHARPRVERTLGLAGKHLYHKVVWSRSRPGTAVVTGTRKSGLSKPRLLPCERFYLSGPRPGARFLSLSNNT